MWHDQTWMTQLIVQDERRAGGPKGLLVQHISTRNRRRQRQFHINGTVRRTRETFAILRIAGKLSQRMIGLPSDYDDPHMIGIFTQAYEQAFASKASDYQMRHHIKLSGSSFFQKHDNIAVLCSSVDKTVGYGSKILRLIPNDNRVGGKLVTALFGNDAYYL